MTTTVAARKLGCSRRTVQRWCARLGWRKEGRDYAIDAGRLSLLAASVQGGPGHQPAA